MRRTSFFWSVLALALFIAGCGPSVGVTPSSIQASGGGGTTLTDVHDIGDVQSRFNQDAGKPRLVLLVSPT